MIIRLTETRYYVMRARGGGKGEEKKLLRSCHTPVIRVQDSHSDQRRLWGGRRQTECVRSH